MFNEKAEKLNGRAAMVGFVAAVGFLSRDRSSNPRFMVRRHVTHSSIHGRRVYICSPIDRWKC